MVSSRLTGYFARRLKARWPLLPLAVLITALHIYRDGETMIWIVTGAAFVLMAVSWPLKIQGEDWGESSKSNPR